MAEAKEKAQETAQEERTDGKKPIRIDVFDKVELKVAQITAADHVEGADKLLKFHMDDGTEEGYTPTDYNGFQGFCFSR